MSQKYRKQFVDALGGIIFDAVGNRIAAAAVGTPTNSIAGYLPGCTYQNLTDPAVVGSIFYVNTGTLASCTWTNVL